MLLINPNKNNSSAEKIYIGVSWPYANGNIHIGHLAGQYVVCDIFARYHRLKGNKVLMVSGSDSHGAPVVFKAEQEGISPEELVEKSHKKIVETYRRLGFLYENYTSTRTDIHREVAQNMFLVLNEAGYLKIKETNQYFDTAVSRFLPDRYVKGTCPECGNSDARGDECPECGLYLEPEQLLDPYSTLSDSKPELRSTKHFYLDLRALQDEISKWANISSVNWRKWVREFSLGWIKQGLEPRPVTRDMTFGVPVPVEGWDEKVLYVWIEAVIGYLSASIEWAEQQGNPSLWEDFWKDSGVKHFYFIAGGNVPFHTVLWPAELIAYNSKYNDKNLYSSYLLPGESTSSPLQLPYDVPGNNMLLYKGKKMSKGDSVGITVEQLLDNYGPDAIRYFFTKYAPEKQDREFIWADFIEANNCELVGNIGNFIFRTLSFSHSRFDGQVPNGTIDNQVAKSINSAFTECGKLIESREFVKSIERVLELGKFANKYFNDHEPWITIKGNPDSAANTIYNSIQIVDALRILLKPFTPFASEKIGIMINTPTQYDPNKELEIEGRVSKLIDLWEFSGVEVGRVIQKPEIVFSKFEYTDELKSQDNPKKEVCEQARDIQFINSGLTKIPTLWKVFPNVKIRKLKPEQREILNRQVEEYVKSFDNVWRNLPTFSGYRDLHDQYSDEKDMPGSVQLLIERTLKEGQPPKVNSLVDIYNYVSIITGVSIGAHDISSISGNVTLRILEEDATFKEISSGDEVIANKGEYAYTDEKGILCRLDIKQSQRTRVSTRTCDVLVILQGHKDIDGKMLENALEHLEKALVQFEVLSDC